MSDTQARVLRPGHRVALGQDVYTVVQLNGTMMRTTLKSTAWTNANWQRWPSSGLRAWR